MPSPSRKEKRQNKSCKQGDRVTHLVEHCRVALYSLQQGTALWPFNTSSKHGTTGTLLTATKGLTSTRKTGSHAQSMLFCCSLILVNIHPVKKHLGPQQGLKLTDRLQTQLHVLAVCRDQMNVASTFRSLSRPFAE